MTSNPPNLTPESPGLFAGRYRVHEVVGRGGMATVYRAEDALLGRVVALKELVEPLADQRRGQQLVDEARAAAALSHPHIATVYDTFEEEGRRYIVMEYVGGASLRDLLDRAGRRLDPDRAVAIAYEMAGALDYAHRSGIIHSDIKPQNILLDLEGHAKLVDFGIARAASQIWAMATTVVGSAAYLAPEQIEGGRADPRSDIYALGVVLYEMLTGALPFEAVTPAALAVQRLVREPVPARIYAPDLPRLLEGIVMRCLAREPGDRYATAWDMGEALDAYRDSEPAPRIEAEPTAEAPPRPPAEHRGAGWRMRLFLIALALLAFTVAAAFVPVLLDNLDDDGRPADSSSEGPAGVPGVTPTAPGTTPESTKTPPATGTPPPAGTPAATPTPVNPFAGPPPPAPFPEAGRPSSAP